MVLFLLPALSILEGNLERARSPLICKHLCAAKKCAGSLHKGCDRIGSIRRGIDNRRVAASSFFAYFSLRKNFAEDAPQEIFTALEEENSPLT